MYSFFSISNFVGLYHLSVYVNIFYRLVIETLKEVAPERRCYRMVGGVLVERTVGDVLPALVTNREQVSFISCSKGWYILYRPIWITIVQDYTFIFLIVLIYSCMINNVWLKLVCGEWMLLYDHIKLIFVKFHVSILLKHLRKFHLDQLKGSSFPKYTFFIYYCS